MPGLDLLCLLDPKQNLLIINRHLFEQLSPEDQKATLGTHETALIIDLVTLTINSATPKGPL